MYDGCVDLGLVLWSLLVRFLLVYGVLRWCLLSLVWWFGVMNVVSPDGIFDTSNCAVRVDWCCSNGSSSRYMVTVFAAGISSKLSCD